MVLWIPPGLFRLRLRGSHPLRPAFPGRSPALTGPFRGPNPGVPSTPVWAPPVSLAATPGITFVFFSSGYLDVSVHRVPPARLWIHRTVAGVSPAGFPHSDTHGSLPICGSPWLFAACRVFLRLLVPRHPPCALPGLTMPAAPPSVAGAGPVSSCFVSASWMSFLIIDFGSLFGFQGTGGFTPRAGNCPPMGLSGLEPPTSRLSGVRSNRLSYKPGNPAATCSPMPSPA